MRFLFLAIAAITCVGTGLSGPARAEANLDYDYNDLNDDGLLEYKEFQNYIYDAWDIDNESRLTEDEFGFYASTHDLRSLSDRLFYHELEGQKPVRQSDKADEFSLETDLFELWNDDQNLFIDADELASVTFTYTDLNGDGYISREEWTDTPLSEE